ETENAAPPSPNYIDTIKQDNQSLPMAGMTQKPKMAMNKMAMQGGMGTDLNDISYDAFLANDRTLEDPDVIRIEPRGRVKLRIINAASSSQFWIDLGKLTGRAVAVDGHDILPIPGQFFPLATAQRLDVIIDLPQSGAFPVLARLEGDYKTTGIILATKGAHITTLESSLVKRAPALDNSFEKILNAARPLSAKPADIVHRMVLDGGMNPYKWSINGAYWPNIVPMMVSYGKRVEVEIINNSMMAHPMHLHGHAFQVVQINGHAISGAVRDTVLVPPMMGSVKIAFDADNPGRWAFHCHNLYHMMSGMMTELRYESIDI
ncbi:MAG: multicopper oxidase domain-containing protein, partial [Rhodospirillales bacterium]|nr:multicopper oxidase domain-containing protein [Rhodospirillales bacterium]